MNPWIFALLAAVGGIGASMRLLVDGLVRSRVDAAYPFGTTIINVSGALLLGLVTGLAGAHLVPEELRLILSTGFLGGYTTFSTASFETVRLLQDGRYGASLLNALGMLVAAVLAAALGLWLGSVL
ncbi:MAG: fluoride efflux transporter CrcB [Lacisediminihabitans sp.]